MKFSNSKDQKIGKIRIVHLVMNSIKETKNAILDVTVLYKL